MYLCFDWSSNCGEFFRRELVKSILVILKRNKNAHAQINFVAKLPFILPNENRPRLSSGSKFFYF